MMITEGESFTSLCCDLASEVVNKGRGKNSATFHLCCWTFRKRRRTPHCHLESILVSQIFGNDKDAKKLGGDEVQEIFLDWLRKQGFSTFYLPAFTFDGALSGACRDRKEGGLVKRVPLKRKPLSATTSPQKVSKPFVLVEERQDDFLKFCLVALQKENERLSAKLRKYESENKLTNSKSIPIERDCDNASIQGAYSEIQYKGQEASNGLSTFLDKVVEKITKRNR